MCMLKTHAIENRIKNQNMNDLVYNDNRRCLLLPPLILAIEETKFRVSEFRVSFRYVSVPLWLASMDLLFKARQRNIAHWSNFEQTTNQPAGQLFCFYLETTNCNLPRVIALCVTVWKCCSCTKLTCFCHDTGEPLQLCATFFRQSF